LNALIVPAEAAEYPGVHAWAEAALSSGALERLDGVSFVRAPYAIRVGGYRLVICDLAGGEERGLELLRAARARGLELPFVFLTGPATTSASSCSEALGRALCVQGAEGSAESLSRATRSLGIAVEHHSSVPESEQAWQEEDRHDAEHLPAEEFAGDGPQQLSATEQGLEEFAYAVVHDLHEPLRGIEAALQEAADARPDAEGDLHEDPIVRASEGVQRVKGMLRDLLECSLVSAKGEPFEPTDLSAPLEWALLNLGVLIEESHARVTSDPLPIVSCDAPQIARVFQNLLENAMKYRGMEPPRIHVSSQTVGDETVVSVCDNGMGIDPAQHEAIFEIFRRGSGARGPGNGVGLALSHRIVERHSGHIWVRSERGKGAAFFFSLNSG